MRRSFVRLALLHEKPTCALHHDVSRDLCRVLRRHTTTDFGLLANATTEVKEFGDMPGPTGRFAIPYIGLAFYFKPFGSHSPDRFHRVVKELNAKYGDIVRLRDRSGWQVFLYDPEDVKHVFQQEGRYPYRYDASIQLVSTYRKDNKLPPGIADAQGEEWGRIRSAMQRYFARPSFAGRFLKVQNEVGDDLVEVIREKGLVLEDSVDEFMKYTAESVGTVCLNKRIGCLLKPEESDFPGAMFLHVIRKGFKALRESFTTVPLFIWFPTKLYRDFNDSINTMTRIAMIEVMKCVNQIREAPESVTEDTDDTNLIHLLLRDGTLSVDEIADNVSTIFGGGVESTAKNLAILLYFLAKNPEKQEQIRQNIMTLGGEGLTMENSSKLNYAKACLKESMRLIPPNTLGTVRHLPKDITLKGYHIPKGTQFAVASIFPDENEVVRHNEFIPERWLRDSPMQKVNPYSHIPFGHGPRRCLGKEIAQQEIFIAVIKILQNFTIELPADRKQESELDYVYNMNPTPVKPLKFIFKELNTRDKHLMNDASLREEGTVCPHQRTA